MSSVFGQEVQPNTTQTYVGNQVTQNVLDGIINTAGINNFGSSYPTLNGITPYGGQLSPNFSDTMLPGVYGAWQPYTTGMDYQGGMMNNSPMSNPFNYVNPALSSMMQYGGTGGPGNKAMSEMMQYGAPSQAGQYESSLAQFGVASKGSGDPLTALAYGQSNPAASYLAPFLTAKPYSAPLVP